ncbi:hypothetical protein, partial [Klebsiella pneumoniae]|uniref:hypothetical protein n=1 Tax=Klebsiella pneumoniae TaxID=573 RepID=UPI0024A9603A
RPLTKNYAMQACLLRGSSLHLCLKAGQLSVVTITRRCRCCLDGLNLQIKLYFRQQTKLYFLSLITYLSVMKGYLF